MGGNLKIFCTLELLLNSILQGFSNFFSKGPDETPVQPERAITVFDGRVGGGGANMCAKRTSRA